MLLCLGESATSNNAGAVSDLQCDGRFFLVPITTGRSQDDASFSQISCYGINDVPLPPLSLADTRKLARACLNGHNDMEEILEDTVFQISLADCGGMPGLVVLLCQQFDVGGKLDVSNFNSQVQQEVTTGIQVWDNHWNSLYSILLARPKLTTRTIIEGKYSISHALDSGIVSYDPEEREIGVAPVVFRTLRNGDGFFNPILLKVVTEAHHWTRQDSEMSHLLYLAATMMALQKEQSRFHKMTLGTFLRHVHPGNNIYLGYRLILPPNVTFDGSMYKSDDEHCLDRPPRRHRHSVDTTSETCVILSKAGTPFMDGYMNLRLRSKESMDMTDLETTVFVQYGHSTMRRAPKLKVSEMNTVINELHTTLVAMQWDNARHWLLLWVTNRPIDVDAKPHEKLLWVGKDNLEKHAPLIARRSLWYAEPELNESNGGCCFRRMSRRMRRRHQGRKRQRNSRR